MTVRPRSVGTFLISRPLTSAKLSARSRMRSMSSRVRSAIEIRWRSRALLLPCEVASRCDLVDAVELLDAHVHALARAVGRFLPT